MSRSMSGGQLPSVRRIPLQGPKKESHKRVVNKEEVEKAGLRARHEGFQRFRGEEIDTPFEIKPQAAFFLPQSQRFATGAASEEKKDRETKITTKQAFIDYKREARTSAESGRWEREEGRKEAEIARVAKLREKGMKAKRNVGSVPYDPITLHYNDNLDGQRLKHADDVIMYRAEVRKHNIHTRMTGHFNPITGDRSTQVSVRTRPTTPPAIKHHMHSKAPLPALPSSSSASSLGAASSSSSSSSAAPPSVPPSRHSAPPSRSSVPATPAPAPPPASASAAS